MTKSTTSGLNNTCRLKHFRCVNLMKISIICILFTAATGQTMLRAEEKNGRNLQNLALELYGINEDSLFGELDSEPTQESSSVTPEDRSSTSAPLVSVQADTIEDEITTTSTPIDESMEEPSISQEDPPVQADTLSDITEEAPDVQADSISDIEPIARMAVNADSIAANVYGNPTPKIGPWPECVGWQGTDCEAYIRTQVDDYPNIDFISPGIPDTHRVFVIVDEFNVVVQVPHRG